MSALARTSLAKSVHDDVRDHAGVRGRPVRPRRYIDGVCGSTPSETSGCIT
ncbi:hypothetical protein ACFWAN_23215 [Streptomyces mirabilis]|uniref:hypothetical protein n=1 Tax=Streptomyces mirabilis TaxID=68239 RepID=UPI00365EAD81